MGSYVGMLRDSLEKKIGILDELIKENDKQKDILLDVNALPEDLDASMDRKTNLLEELDTLDSGFNEVFNRVKLELERYRAAYSDDIERMKTLIRMIMDRSAQIELQEADNKELAEKKFTHIREQVQKVAVSQKAVNRYYNNMMRVNLVDPQFMDNKK